jgi:hypothetical protein
LVADALGFHDLLVHVAGRKGLSRLDVDISPVALSTRFSDRSSARPSKRPLKPARSHRCVDALGATIVYCEHSLLRHPKSVHVASSTFGVALFTAFSRCRTAGRERELIRLS